MDTFLNKKRMLDDYDEDNGKKNKELKTVTETIKSCPQSSGAGQNYLINR